MTFPCSLCEKTFKERFTLNRHYKNVHNSQPELKSYDVNKYKIKCLEENCNTSYRERADLVQHLRQVHNFVIETEELQFQNYNEFEIWKSNIEIQEKCNYVKQQGKKLKGNRTIVIEKCYYVCNRSVKPGNPKVLNNKRGTKSQGSCKLPHACISSMIVLNTDNDISVSRIKSHYGHKVELQHLRLNKEDCVYIAEKLAIGASKERIINDNRSNISNELKRLDLLTRQDITNIQKRFNTQIHDGVKHKNDATSVDMWVRECQNNAEDNPILFYKQQGDQAVSFENQDFCLIIMNKYQEHMLTTFGPNIVCVDSTHGLNNYDFELTTLLIVDNYGEGFPVAFMFTNRKDVFVHEKFFSVVKSRVGVIKCNTFMSDITTVFYTAWVSTMGEADNQLFCSWHIDHAWKSNLSKISNVEKKNLVYKTIKVLQQSVEFTDEEDFKNQLHTAITMMLQDKETHNFGMYFEKNYSNNYHKWGYFFRKGCGINTNDYLESMHKVIKYFYLNRKTVKRLDIGLHAVLRYTRDKMVDRLIKNTKGKRTKLISHIQNRHKTAKESLFEVEKIEENKWVVSHDSCSYYVMKNLERNCCITVCTACNVCLHVYCCTCVDYYMRSCICKHIHYIAIQNAGNDMNQVDVTEQQNEDNELCLETLSRNSSSNTTTNKDKITAAVSVIQQTLSSSINFESIDSSVVTQVCSLLQNANALLTVRRESQNFSGAENSSSTLSIIEKQRRFYSTKSKTKRQHSINKPTTEETKQIKSFLSGEELYTSTSSNNDHNYF